MLEAILFGHEVIKKLVAFQEQIVEKVGSRKWNSNCIRSIPDWKNACGTYATDSLIQADSGHEKQERQDAIDR